MTDFADYERRIAYALERIGRGVDELLVQPEPEEAVPEPEAPVVLAQDSAEPIAFAPVAVNNDGAELRRLRDALEIERMEKDQLAERVRVLRDKQETTLAAMEKRLTIASRKVEIAHAETARLKRANLDLADANAALVEAGGVVSPELADAAQQAELAALRAARSVDVAEIDNILSVLAPLVKAQTKEGGKNA